MKTVTSNTARPIAPYMAIGLSTVAYCIAERKHIRHNLETIEDAIHAAVSMISINTPVKIIALAEGALTGFTDEIFDLSHTLAARELFIGRELRYAPQIKGNCAVAWVTLLEKRKG